MTTDKNGNKLKVGDKIIYYYDWAFTIIALNKYSDLPIETINKLTGDIWTFPSHMIELVIPEPVERTYSRAEMNQSFKAGYKRSEYGAFDQFLKKRVPDFQEFIESLNPPKT